MKKFIAISLVSLLLLLISFPASAQDEPPKNLFKINLLSPLVRTGSFFYERALSNDLSLQLGFFYTGATVGETEFRGMGITPELRYYLSEKHSAPRGVFIAPFGRYQNFNVENTDAEPVSKGTITSFGGGLLIGTQTLFKNRISLDVWAGPAYYSSKTKVTVGNEEDFELGSFDGFTVRFGITVGIGF